MRFKKLQCLLYNKLDICDDNESAFSSVFTYIILLAIGVNNALTGSLYEQIEVIL